jgi:hypothetical protein
MTQLQFRNVDFCGRKTGEKSRPQWSEASVLTTSYLASKLVKRNHLYQFWVEKFTQHAISTQLSLFCTASVV